MSYSRKQLYAMGEPFGESATRHKLGGRIYGGGGQPSTTTQVSELPEWARGYAKESLGKAAALTDTSQNPYQTYDAPRIAGFSPLQQQAQQQAAGMTAAPQLAPATGLTAEAGLRGLEARYDPTQFASGQFGQGEAEQYMSPYMQSVVDIQKREAQRQSDIGATQRGAQATAAGAFGGSRQAIVEAEAQRNLAQQKGDIQAQGSQAAFQQAQAQFNADQARRMQAQQLAEQSKQYGAGYGMQGLGMALQGAGQLGQLGVQQFTQGMDINKLQSAYGGQQQALQQQGLSQAYQDFQNQQNYPYKQLGFMSDLIRGLPLGQQSTAQVYEANPSFASTAAGLGTAALGLSKFMAEGGVTGDANVSSILDRLSDAQLEQAKQQAVQSQDEDRVREIEGIQRERASARAGMSTAPQQEPQGGIAAAASDSMMDRMLPTEEGMARGGIVAFSNGGTMEGFEPSPEFVEAQESTGDERNRAKTIADLERKIAFLSNAAPEQAPAVRAQLEAFKTSGATTLPSPAAPAGSIATTLPAARAEVGPVAKEGLSGPVAQAALPPDISTMGKRGASSAAPVASVVQGQDFEKLYEDILTKTKKANQADPYAAQTAELGQMNIKRTEDKKAAMEADQAKFAKAFEGQEERIGKREADIGKRSDMNTGLALIGMGATIMSTPGGLAKAIGKGALVGTEQFARGLEKIEQAKSLIDKARDDLDNLRLNRAEMSARDIRQANDDISGAQIKAKELTLTGLREAGADTKEKAKMIYESTVKQQLAREAQAAAARTAAATADKPGETERMMTQLGAIQSGKASFAGKTGEEGAKAFQDSLGQIGAGKYGARYTGPAAKPVTYSPADKKLAESLGDQLSFLATKPQTDKASQEKAARIRDALSTLEKKYTGASAALPTSVSTGGKTYARPANFTDAQWSAYVQSVGAK